MVFITATLYKIHLMLFLNTIAELNVLDPCKGCPWPFLYTFESWNYPHACSGRSFSVVHSSSPPSCFQAKFNLALMIHIVLWSILSPVTIVTIRVTCTNLSLDLFPLSNALETLLAISRLYWSCESHFISEKRKKRKKQKSKTSIGQALFGNCL